MITSILKGKGKSNDIIVLRLLLEHCPITISEMTKLDGLDQDFRERRQRGKLYHRALHGRKDSSDPGLLILGCANRDTRLVGGKLTGVYSITERGVRELFYVEVLDGFGNAAQKILEGKGIDKILKAALETRTDPIYLIPDVRHLTDETSGECVEFTAREFRKRQEYFKFDKWFKETYPQLYSEWRAKGLPIVEVLGKAGSELVERVKRDFPLNTERWGLWRKQLNGNT